MKRRDVTPLVMWMVLFAGIIAVAWFRQGRAPRLWAPYPVNVDLLFVATYLVWMVLEVQVSGKDLQTEGTRRSDGGTCQLYGAGQGLTILSALWFTSLWHVPNSAHWVGFGLFLLGVGYRLWAIRTLGVFYSHRVQVVSDHQVVDTGPYRFCRHPAYAGMIVAHAGICLYFLNVVTICVFALLLVPAILLRIAVEERTLFEIDGYAQYADGRKRLFPVIW